MSLEQRRTLEAWIRAHNTPQSIARRAKIALLAADGLSNVRIAREAGVSRPTVILWRKRFLQGGPEAIATILPGRGRPVTYTTDRRFTEKLTDVVGLYLNPPDKAIVLCVDEKSQIQALQRTQPGLPMKKGRCGTMTHDYKRHGTTTLFAALNILDGRVIGECMTKHRHQEFLLFLRRLDREFPKGMPLHLIVDNYGTHKQPRVKAWLDKHPRFHMHFTPTSSSWLNLVERWFRDLTEKRVRRGSFESAAELIAAIEDYMAASNADPKPFVWHKSAHAILDKLARCKAIYETLD
jgi:hypothetical protein